MRVRVPRLAGPLAGALALLASGGTAPQRIAARIEANGVAAQGSTPLVRQLSAHRAYGRTEVRVIGTGLRHYRLSEPFRVRGRWRLYLTLDGARLSLYAPRAPLAAGAVSKLGAEQRRGEVRITVESSSLGQYGFRAAGDTLIVWLMAANTAAAPATTTSRGQPVANHSSRAL